MSPTTGPLCRWLHGQMPHVDAGLQPWGQPWLLPGAPAGSWGVKATARWETPASGRVISSLNQLSTE